MSPTLREIGLAYIDGFRTLSGDSFLSLLAPNAVHTFAPASLSPPAPKGPAEFATHIEGLRSILEGFPVYATEIFENQEMGQITILATSETRFRPEAKDDGLTADEWLYKGEYVFILTLDERKEKVAKIYEFLDSKKTEELRKIVARAKENVKKANGEDTGLSF